MQLMTFNSLLMFDIVFVFFLFLVGVTCLVYYMPPASSRSSPSASSTSTSSSLISNSGSSHSDISASVATKKCRHFGHSYQALHHHHHMRDHYASANRMATHREHGFAAAAVLSSVDCELPEVAELGVKRDDRFRESRSGSATIEFFTATAATAAKFADEGRLLVERPATCVQMPEATATVATTSGEAGGATRTVPQCCYVKEKWQRSSLSSSRKLHQALVHEV